MFFILNGIKLPVTILAAYRNMSFLVNLQTTPKSEDFPTAIAAVSLLVPMLVLMHLQIAAVAKAFPANLAFVTEDFIVALLHMNRQTQKKLSAYFA